MLIDVERFGSWWVVLFPREVGKRREVHPGAQCTQCMVAERTPERSGEPLVVLGEEVMTS